MALQATLGSGGLIAAGIGVSDVATIVTLAGRLGNWYTAEKGDAELFALLEEDEYDVLKRRGIMDINRFQTRWNRKMRLLENGRPRKLEGKQVERLLCSSSNWTAMMTCVVAALDEFASAATTRNICKGLLQRIFSSQDGVGMTEDILSSSLQIRINGWRSAATVREMNIACRRVRIDLLHQGLIVQGFMPANETAEVIDFLHWLMVKDSDTYHTSSSDIAAIALCLCFLSFEILKIENFGRQPDRETPCRLVYSRAPLFNGRSAIANDTRNMISKRELSTTVSLTQPEETFSTFPITAETATRCRVAWQQGAEAGEFISLRPFAELESSFTQNDLIMEFRNQGTKVSKQRRKDSGPWRIASLLAIFSTEEVNDRLAEVLCKENPDTLSRVANLIRNSRAPDGSETGLTIDDSRVLEAFTVCQAFFMGYYYQIFSQIVDTSTLEIQTISGCWGYQDATLLRRIHASFRGMNGLYSGSDDNSFCMTRTDILSLLATLYANADVQIPKGVVGGPLNHQELCVGVVGKRIVLFNSLLNNCETLEDIFRFVVLDCDAGALPRNTEGLMLTGIPQSFPTWDGMSPKTEQDVILSGPREDCTRHIEANWDGNPERMLLCIRYKGRRLGSLNPIHADRAFRVAFLSPDDNDDPGKPFGPMHSCDLEDLVVSCRLVTPGRDSPRTPVAVHTKGSPCLRYAAAAWYSDHGDVLFAGGNLQRAFEKWEQGSGKAEKYNGQFVALIG